MKMVQGGNYTNYDQCIGVSITDYQGRLSLKRILVQFKESIETERKILEMALAGKDPTDMIPTTGRGLHLIRQMAQEYYFNIKKSIKTEIILLSYFADENLKKNSNPIKITEID